MGMRIELNSKAIAELLTSHEVLDELTERGHRIADAAGPGHEVDPFIGANRARVTVRTATVEAAVAEATTRALSNALEAGRG